MGTSIRAYGDNQRIVVRTDEQATLNKLARLAACQGVVYYRQAISQGKPDAWPIVAADLYFAKEQEARLRRDLGLLDQPRVASQRKAAPTKGATGTSMRGKKQGAGISETQVGEPKWPSRRPTDGLRNAF